MNRKARMFCGWLLALWGLSLVLPLWASAADDELKQGDWVIALSNSYYGNTWRKQMVEVFEAAAQEAKARGYIKDYIVLNGDGSINTQVAHMNSLILRNVDAIAINAASPTALNGVIEEAHRAGIKVLAFDSIVTSPYAWKLDRPDGAGGTLAPAGCRHHAVGAMRRQRCTQSVGVLAGSPAGHRSSPEGSIAGTV